MRLINSPENGCSLLSAMAVAALASLLAVALLVARWQLAPPSTVALNVGDPATPVSHFFDVENSEGRAFRWSRTLSAVTLPALASSQVVTVTANPTREGAAFRLLAGTRVIGEYAASPGWGTYTATTGVRFAPDLRLLIESDTFYPSSADRRRLGIAVSAVETSAMPGRLGIVLPPFLWLIVAAGCPVIAIFAAGRARLTARAALGLAGAALPLAASLAVPPAWALQGATWFVGLSAVGLLALIARNRFDNGGPLTRAFDTIGSSRWELPAVAALVAALSVLQSWPLVTRLDSTMPGWPADNFAFLYKFWWFRTALLEEGRSPFFDPYSFAPFGFNLGQGEPTFANTLPGVLIGALFNDVVAYNLVALSSFVVSGLGGYLLVRELTGSKSAALLAALAFAFCPFRMAQFAGHIQLLGTGWIALAFYFVERTLRGRTWYNGAFAGASLALAALSAWYYAYMAGLLLAFYILLRLWAERRATAVKDVIAPGLAGAAAFAMLVVPAALPSLSIWEEGSLHHSAKAADEHSAAPLDFAIPNPVHPIWGEPFMRAHAEQNVIESSLYLGAVVGIIALAGLIMRWRFKARSSAAVTWLVVGVVSFVLSLGLTLHDANGQVKLETAGGSAPVPLPGQLLYDWLPFYSSMRAYARFGVITALAAVVLMGFGWRFIVKRWPVRERWLTMLACLLLLADFWTGPFAWGTTRVERPAVADHLADAPPGTVIQLPVNSAVTGPALYWATYYGKPIAYGYDTFEPKGWRDARPALQSFPDPPALDTLRSWGVRYVVVSANAYGADWAGTLAYLKSLPTLRHLGDFPDHRRWDVDPGVVDARPDMEEYLAPDTHALFELVSD